ncbi:MAG: hypothetical protein NVS2B14_07760 [Chamaesiphon sp.]
MLDLSFSATKERSHESSVPHLRQPHLRTSLLAALTNVEGVTQILGSSKNSRETLGLLLSCGLAELHGGQIFVEGSPESGYRYEVSLPQLARSDERQ